MRQDRCVYLPPISATPPEDALPGGHSYGGVILPAGDVELGDLLALLRVIRFSGWVAPPQDGWIVVLGDPGAGVVANGRRGVLEVGALLAERIPGPSLAIRVLRDRQLALVAWRGGEELVRYCSDPSREPGADEEVLSEPLGAGSAELVAKLWDRPDAAEPLGELLEEELDPDSVYESERLGQVLRVLGLPAWLVAAGELPRRMPTGPAPSEFIRLRAGEAGWRGRAFGAFVRPVRRRQTAPPVIADPPRGNDMGFEGWMY